MNHKMSAVTAAIHIAVFIAVCAGMLFCSFRIKAAAAETGSEQCREDAFLYQKEKNAALFALESRMNEECDAVYVYKDFGLTTNHFTQKAKMAGINSSLVMDLDENERSNPYKGSSCIRCEQITREGDWGGWLFLNGFLPRGESTPHLNDGSMDGQGMNLSGADALQFYARGEKGGETVEFFSCGFGYDGMTHVQTVRYPDSTDRKSTGWVTLTKEWKEYTIPLNDTDLSYVVCGFGYTLNGTMSGRKDNIFYLDEIRFTGNIRSAQEAPVLLRSYDTDNLYLSNTAFSYDNALAAMAFLSEGRQVEAKKILDAFVYAIQNDRAFYTAHAADAPSEAASSAPADASGEAASSAPADVSGEAASSAPADVSGEAARSAPADTSREASRADSGFAASEPPRYRVRNAYAAGDLSPAPGWETGARLPGWYDNETGAWYEDRYQVGGNVGNTSYTALAFLQYYRLYGGEEYLKMACSLMDWVLETCQDGRDGFTGGFDGWEEGKPPVIYPLLYKSIEHNIDAFAAFQALYEITGEKRYDDAARSARRLIESLYDREQGRFLTGTIEDGTTPNESVIVLDAQVWCAMALGKSFEPYLPALQTVEKMKTPEGGYSFCLENKNGGWWAEGTAYTALMYRLTGEEEKYEEAMEALVSIQQDSGLFPAATVEHLSTGMELFDGSPWEYSSDPHIAPTAWFILAVNRWNPYE